MTVAELYESAIKPLSPGERLELVKLILNDIPSQALVDYSPAWSEEDLRDAAAHSLRRAAEMLCGADDDDERGSARLRP